MLILNEINEINIKIIIFIFFWYIILDIYTWGFVYGGNKYLCLINYYNII
jgi:hypothetical protein